MENELTLSNYFNLLADSQSLPDLFFEIAGHAPDQTVYTQPAGPRRTIKSESYSAVLEKVLKLAKALQNLGVHKGDRVAICSATRPEWMIADLAILSIGAVSVSIYQTLNKEEMAFILLDSGSSVLFAENQEQLNKTLAILETSHTYPSIEGRPAEERRISLRKIFTFEETTKHPLVESISSIFERTSSDSLRTAKLTREDFASIVYTSGTTGFPKGVPQTHGNHLSNLFQATRTELFGLDGDLFLFLPLAHAFARLMGYIGFLTTAIVRFPGVSDKEASTVSIPGVMRDLHEAGANVVPCVPRILEKIKAGIEEKAAGRKVSSALLRATIKNALQYYHSKGQQGAFLHWLLSPIRRKIKRQIFGSRFEHIVSGGAKLALNVCEFFLALECTIYQGYGLTETCVATNVNLRGRNKPGSVGPCLYGIEIKIAEDGEILFRGPNITQGYWNRPQATKDSWDGDGFFHTGDQGRLDEDNFLWITGRKKELIVSSTGKKVVPGPIEEQLMATGIVTQAVLLGDERSYCVAILVPSIASIARAINKANPSDDEIRAVLQKEVDRTNAGLSKHEEVKKFAIIKEEFTVDNGLLTPTLKVRRGEVAARYKKEISAMY